MAIQVHEKKYNRQVLGVDRWRNAKTYGSSHSNCWGTWWWQTGVGKTYATCIVINRILKHNSANTIVIMVPGPELKRQWEAEIKSNVLETYHINIRVFTVGEILKFANSGQRIICSLFVADELHEYYTVERRKIFDGQTVVITKWMLGLTADYEDKDKRYKEIESILPVVDRITEEEALKEGYISKYIEYNVAVDLTVQELEKYKMLSDIISKNLGKFGNRGLELASKILIGDKAGKGIEYAIRYATERGWRSNLNPANADDCKILEVWTPNKVIGYAKLAMENIRERKNLLYFSMNKLKVAKEVVIKFENLKTICFSQSTLFADTLAKVINNHYESFQHSRKCIVYHSQLDTVISYDERGNQKKKGKTVLKREAIEAIKNSKNDIISTASSLDKGFDVKDIRLCLTTSGTQNPTQYNQRKGRGVRVEDYEKENIVLIINLYIRNTMDEQWLKKRQSKSNNVVYWVDKVDDINYTIKTNYENDNVEI